MKRDKFLKETEKQIAIKTRSELGIIKVNYVRVREERMKQSQNILSQTPVKISEIALKVKK